MDKITLTLNYLEEQKSFLSDFSGLDAHDNGDFQRGRLSLVEDLIDNLKKGIEVMDV